MIIKPEDILKLDEILKPCVELTSLSLTLRVNHRNDALRHKLANDVSLLIGHHLTVEWLVLRNFKDLLVGYLDKYRLPTSLETLELDRTIFMGVDLEHGKDASTTSHIRDLKISNSLSPSEIEGCLKFVESHAETLVSLRIDFCWGEHQPTMDRLKHMAKRLAKFNKLQNFTYDVKNVHDILVILRDVMPLIAINQSLTSYSISSDSSLFRYNRDFLQALQLAMKKICIGRRRVLDFGSVFLDVDYPLYGDGNPTVQYHDVRELQDNPLDYDSDCEYYRDGDFDFDDVILND